MPFNNYLGKAVSRYDKCIYNKQHQIHWHYYYATLKLAAIYHFVNENRTVTDIFVFVTSAYVTERIICATSISPCTYFAYLDYTSTLKSRLDMEIMVFKEKEIDV